ncbi:D-amino acid dehydrogenase [Marinobacter lutaoensis]|jgi:D-amino-acid dehydrogenase|uniref:FAD-dependent oxidoreductase n=1 Tax=Marinobacter lutaoensis TaxID=135739 RepID=A0A1V2DS74_9GAMM|nr:D-amino acid dehydrogenase [Marinobacter lutaoensis]MBE02335.1 D-amino acid dehydrogenase [Marinobacter sp.]NVD35892.1 D-amino acid dehydrogenase [Marinobacter lutaoensis]ONF43574.1 FAD-dependent oxidoreductase [Marinobacter lutaoensis]|tara:strand:+ start:3991 stop:5262 length:1272 start_codon:yes stop_codon:yes gene_type:complete
MRIVVIGGGVVGVTTAFELNRRGHEVTVLERHDRAGNETSKGNAAQRSYGVVYPWADPAMVFKALPWLLRRDGPLKLRVPPSVEAVRFLFATLRYAWSPGLFGLNRRAMLRLGMHSRARFLALEEELELAFDQAHRGVLHLASTPEALQEYRRIQALLAEVGVPSRLLTPAQVREAEPGMVGDGPLYGGLSYDTDGTGDCHRFSQALAGVAAQRGVTFRYNVEVERLVADERRVEAVTIRTPEGERERVAADAFVVCAGCWSPSLVRPLGLTLPIYPVKGYSITVPLSNPEHAPTSTIHDDHYKVVSTRLGNRLRATGFVELADFNRDIPEARIATIRKSVMSRYPGCADLDAAETWTGFRPMTPDGPAIIGRGGRDNLYLNTGHGTFGWTLSAGSADVIAQVIDGEPPAVCLDAFRPGRFQE